MNSVSKKKQTMLGIIRKRLENEREQNATV